MIVRSVLSDVTNENMSNVPNTVPAVQPRSTFPRKASWCMPRRIVLTKHGVVGAVPLRGTVEQCPPGDVAIPAIDVLAKHVSVKMEDETADTDRATELVPFIDLREKAQNAQCAGCAARAQLEHTVEAYRQRRWLALLRLPSRQPSLL